VLRKEDPVRKRGKEFKRGEKREKIGKNYNVERRAVEANQITKNRPQQRLNLE